MNTNSRGWRGVALPVCCAWLSACGTFGPSPRAEPATAALAAPAVPVRGLGLGATVFVGNEQSGGAVELGREQQLGVRLRFAGATNSDWTLLAVEPGVLQQVGATHYEQDPTAAAYGEVAGTQVWRFQPLTTGQVTLRFELRVPHSRAPATETASFAVTVR